MGKGKKDKAKSKSRKKTGSAEAELPPTIAGVEVPQELRKLGAVVVDLAQSPLAREIVAASFMAGVAAVANNREVRRKAADTAEEIGEEADRAGGAVKAALAAAGAELGRRLIDVARTVDQDKRRGSESEKA